MRRIAPRSLIGQMALLIGIALFAAQLVNFALLLSERQKLTLAQTQGPAITRFVSATSSFVRARGDDRLAVLDDNSQRGAFFRITDSTDVPTQGREPATETRLREMLVEAGIKPIDVRAGFRAFEPPRRAPPRPNEPRRDRGRSEFRALVLAAEIEPNVWMNGGFVMPPRDPWLSVRLAASTLILYIIVLGATLFIARRMARPLRDLTSAAEQFGGHGQPVPVEPSGPADLRRAIDAFNAMNQRVVALLDEKDRMLGAIGHDLRTPLASLRIRAEAVEPEAERERVIATIEEMSAMLEDILDLARSGRPHEEIRRIDVTALVDALVEEYRELGQQVELMPSGREVLAIRPNLVRRAVRNLIDNALKYGGSAQVRVTRAGEAVAIKVADKGPGLPKEMLEDVLEPFTRGEVSRSRETGGAGLGLAIVKALAEAHGGSLRLANARAGGLTATLTIAEGAA
jgi:signal transduction histidine kinase